LPGGVPLGTTFTVILLGLVLIPALLRGFRRVRRLRAVRQGTSSAGWAELVDTARDYGLSAPLTQTPRELAHQLGKYIGRSVPAEENARAQHAQDQQALHRLLLQIEVSRYARVGRPDSSEPDSSEQDSSEPTGAVPPIDDLRRLRRALWQASDASTRLRAILLPRSVFANR
jgi:hypothetical protein